MLINVVVVEPVCSVKHALQNTQNDCHQWLFDSSRVHQIRFRGPRWGAHGAPPDPLVGWGGGYPLPIPYHLDAFSVSVTVYIISGLGARSSTPQQS